MYVGVLLEVHKMGFTCLAIPGAGSFGRLCAFSGQILLYVCIFSSASVTNVDGQYVPHRLRYFVIRYSMGGVP